jgi:hypothetical protein
MHDSEFRYVLQPGEGISGGHNQPIKAEFFREKCHLIESP